MEDTNKKVIFFGTGSLSSKISLAFDKIDYFVDNDSKKWKSQFQGKLIESPEILKIEKKEEIIIIVASSFYNEISNQLKEMSFLENVHFFKGQDVYNHTLNGELFIIEKLINDGDIIFDIGANLGNWSNNVYKKKKNVTIHFFEPIPYVYKKLITNINDEKAIFNNISLSKEEGIDSFYFYEKASSISTFFRRLSVEKEMDLLPPKVIPVFKTTLDKYCEKLNINRVNFMKIDVEGAELDILFGTKEMLLHEKIDYLQFEYGGTYIDANITLKEVFNFITSFNYSIFKITVGNKLVPYYNWKDKYENYQYSNFLVVHNRLLSYVTGNKSKLFDLQEMLTKYRIEPKGVIHVGAHEGIEVSNYLSSGFENILFIEANPDVYKRLVQNVARYPEVSTLNIAVSDQNGEIDFNVTSMDQSSSLLPLKKHKEYYPGIEEVRKIKVLSKRLDDILIHYNLSHYKYNVLNIDIQGAELLALKGARNLLNDIEAINVEVNFTELYEGCALIEDIDVFLNNYGFQRVEVCSPYHPSWGDAFYIKKPLITMSSIGENGRFGNQLFQYAFLRIYALKHNLSVETPRWIGQYLFGHSDPMIHKSLPEIKQTSFLRYEDDIFSENTYLNVDIWGYFQYHTSFYNEYKDYFESLFTPVPEINNTVEHAWQKLFKNGKNTVVGLHIRRGDFGYGYFYETPTSWYKDWLECLWDTLENPVLYIASDEPEKVIPEFNEYNPKTAKDLGIEIPEAPFFIDFYILTQCYVLAISNSSFSYIASMLNKKSKIFARPNLKCNKLIPFDPWKSDVLLRDVKYEQPAKIRFNSYISNLKNEKILIYGAGEHTVQLFNKTNLRGKKIVGLVDKDKNKKQLLNLKIYNIKDISEIDSDVILISSFEYQEEIYNNLINIGYSGQIYKIYNDDDKYSVDKW